MSNVLKVAAGLNALAVVGHGVMGLVDLFPVLDASPPSKMRTAAKIGWMEGCGYFALSSLLMHKVATAGAGQYERLMLLVVFTQNFLAGWGYFRSKQPVPVLALWGTSSLLALGYINEGI
jgi:hypothetical protein